MRLINPIRLVAVICVAVTSAYVMFMGYHLSEILASPGWCGKALQAEKISSQNFGGLTACVDLLKIQLNALARVSLVYSGTIALCLLTLIVIVIAKAKLDAALPGGGNINMAPADAEPIPVTVTNAPSEPVPTAPQMPETGPATPL